MNPEAPEFSSISLGKTSFVTSNLNPEAPIFTMSSDSNINNQVQQGGGKSSMTKSDSSRIQSSQVSKSHDGGERLMYADLMKAKGGNSTGKGSFAARAQSAVDKNGGGKSGRSGGSKK